MNRDRAPQPAADYRDEAYEDDDGEGREHRPVFNVSHLDHTTCLHLNDPALHLLLDFVDEIDMGQIQDGTARAMFHHLYNAGERRPPRRERRG